MALDSPISAQLQRSALAAFAPRDTFFLHNFSFFLSSQTLQSFVQIYPENCLNQYVLSLEFFTEDFHLYRQATRIQSEDKGDRSNNGSAQKFKHTEIGEEAIAMAVQTLDRLLPHPLLRRVSPRVTLQSAGEQPQCHRTCDSCLWERVRTVFPFVTTNFKDNRFLSPSSKNKQISTNFVTVASTKCFWEGFGKFCFSSVNSTNFTNCGNFLEKIRQFFLIILFLKTLPLQGFSFNFVISKIC
jgi:hypothetical protein